MELENFVPSRQESSNGLHPAHHCRLFDILAPPLSASQQDKTERPAGYQRSQGIHSRQMHFAQCQKLQTSRSKLCGRFSSSIYIIGKSVEKLRSTLSTIRHLNFSKGPLLLEERASDPLPPGEGNEVCGRPANFSVGFWVRLDHARLALLA